MDAKRIFNLFIESLEYRYNNDSKVIDARKALIYAIAHECDNSIKCSTDIEVAYDNLYAAIENWQINNIDVLKNTAQ